MARVLFVTWDGRGNQPPTIGLAQELRRRGHEIVVAGYASQESRFTARDLPYVLLERSQEALERASSGGPLTILLDGWMLCAPQLQEVPEAFARERADALVVDCMLFAALAAAEVARLPTAVLVHTAPGALFHPERVMAQHVPGPLNVMRAAAGLKPVERLWDAWTTMAVLCTSIPQLDPLLAEVPAAFDYVGPIAEEAAPSGWRPPWSSDDGRPLVLVSFSTGGQPQRSRVERTLGALARMPVRVLVTGRGREVDGITLPENAALVPFVPHGEVLPNAAAVVTHAGHGTVTAALAHGVPLVCLPSPIIADQGPLATQVARLGAGRALDGESASAEEIAAALGSVLADPRYRAAAQALARVIAASHGAATAASRIERLAVRSAQVASLAQPV